MSPPPRERSPLRKGGQGPPVVDDRDFKPRFIEWDDSLKPDRIRGIFPHPKSIVLMIVLSRTLFVGGITSRISEDKVRALFSQFGGVQSIIMNPEKRCAFLKMYTREGAINARAGMETYPTDDTTIRVPSRTPQIYTNVRQNMVSDSDHEIVQITPQASPSSPSPVSRTPIVNGSSQQNTAAQAVDPSKQA